MTERVLLVGESNPHSSDPRYALWPRPVGATGDRLCKILCIDAAAYLRTYDRVNLCTSRWNARDARDITSGLHHRVRILLGCKVAEAHGIKDWVPFQIYDLGSCRALALPHPSGRCRYWNDPEASHRARAMAAELVDPWPV